MKDITNAVRAAFAQQAKWCEALGSPLTALVLDQVGKHLDRSSPVACRILDWPLEGLVASALPLRVAAGLHGLVRRGSLPGLAMHYPPNALPAGTAAIRAFSQQIEYAFIDSGTELSPWLDSPPQTNEVARSAILMAGLTEVTARTRRPIALHELGASAGLNLIPDRYDHDLGHARVGQLHAQLRLSPQWRGAPLPSARVVIATRRGVDLDPLDVTNATHRERLMAYIWADQHERLARIAIAIEIARRHPPKVDAGDAADWTEQHFHGRSGMTSVLMHSVAMQYFPAMSQARIIAHVQALGQRATQGAPIAWLRFEMPVDRVAPPVLTLTLWPGGIERVLAHGSAHGHWINWLG